MTVRPRLRRTVMVMGAVGILTSTPSLVEAQNCAPGALSAYLASAGVGCTFGQLRLRQFASTNLASVADQVFIDPFTLQGPPGYTWVGFSVRFGAGLNFARETPVDLSFFSENAPLYGLMAQTNLIGTPLFAGTTRARLTGDGGMLKSHDRINNSLLRDLQACARLGSAPLSCASGSSSWTGGYLPDTDNGYRVDATSFVATASTPYDYTVAILTNNATLAPEPATLLLLSSGLGGVGAMLRRRRKNS